MISRDILIKNVQIYDPASERFLGDTLVVRLNRIFAFGKFDQVKLAAGRDADIIDGKNQLLLPAFYDSHTHFLGYVKRQSEVALGKCRSLSEALVAIKQKIDQLPKGSWITGGGWNKNQWAEGEYPTRHQLDQISQDHFIALDSKDWHTMWVNTPVLNLANIPLDRPYEGAKHLAIDPKTGEFTGVLEEHQRVVIFDLMPLLNYTGIKKTYQAVRCEFYKCGFAGVHSMETAAEFTAYQEAHKAGDLDFRVFWYAPIKHAPDFKRIGIQSGFGNQMLQISGLKIFVDGAFGSQTAELFENYNELGHSGVAVLPQNKLEQMIGDAVDAGLNCAVHAIGDKAIHKTLNAFEKFAGLSAAKGLRHRIEHVQMVQPPDLVRFKKARVIASMQPVHLAADVKLMQKYLGNRCRLTYLNGSLLNAGAKLIFGSDTPIEPFNPWLAIYAAMERKYLLDEKEPSFYPAEKLNLSECLKAYTCNSAYSVGMEQQMGKIEKGALADLTILDRDIFSAPVSAIKSTSALFTMVDGKIVYNKLN